MIQVNYTAVKKSEEEGGREINKFIDFVFLPKIWESLGDSN